MSVSSPSYYLSPSLAVSLYALFPCTKYFVFVDISKAGTFQSFFGKACGRMKNQPSNKRDKINRAITLVIQSNSVNRLFTNDFRCIFVSFQFSEYRIIASRPALAYSTRIKGLLALKSFLQVLKLCTIQQLKHCIIQKLKKSIIQYNYPYNII